jgi:hypothetical protein
LPTDHRPDAAHIYEIVSHWVGSCLVEDGSLFTPGKDVWKPSA